MKTSVCSHLVLAILIILQSLHQLHHGVWGLEYSVEGQVYIVKSLVQDHHAISPSHEQQYAEREPLNQRYDEQQQPQQMNQNKQQVGYQKHSHSHQQHPQQPDNLLAHSTNPHQPQLHENQLNQLNQQHPQHHHHNHHHQQQQQLSPPQPQLLQTTHQQQQQHHVQSHILTHHHEQQSYDGLEHRTLKSTIQEVLLDTPDGQYHIARAQIELKHESTHEVELNEIYMHNYEASYPVITQDELTYNQYHLLKQQQQQRHYHHHHQSMNMFSKKLNDNHDYVMNNRPAGSCHPHDPSILMHNDHQEPTCRAKTASANNPIVPSEPVTVPSFSQLTTKPSQNSNVEAYPLAPHHYHYESSLMSAIRHYWREVSGLCLASAIFLNWLFVVIKRRFVPASSSHVDHAIQSLQQPTTRSISKDTNSSAHDSAFEETASPPSFDDIDVSGSSSDQQDKSTNSVPITNTSSSMRPRSSTLKAQTSPILIPVASGHNSQPGSLSNSLNASEYNSRYSSDFDSIQRLGRGGFGVVFEAKNKIDDCHYAVKRICLPLEKEARERVMREVRALAKLDHAGIVRYYNAWLETPPDEWLKQHDAKLGIVHSRDGMSFPSTDGIYDRNESEQIHKIGFDSKMGDSGDNSSGWFGNGQLKRRPNGYRKFLKNNSSSPSLDIVFEGSGSIRLESEDTTERSISDDIIPDPRSRFAGCENGDINSDSEDSDFIQFESRSNDARTRKNIDGEELSTTSHLTDPFSSSSSDREDNGYPAKDKIDKPDAHAFRKNALNRQREMRKLNNASLAENANVEKVYLYIQMQLCRKDTLKDWLKTNCEQRDKTAIFDLFYQIVDAVEYVHSQDLIHRDLKPSNIFFSLDGTLKIGDFGLCRAKTSVGIGSSLDLQEYVAESDVERGFEAVHTEQVGTQLYMSPEQLNGLCYNQKVDIFAMGLILLELLVPFKTQMQRVNVLFKARNNLYSGEFQEEHPREYELVKSLLNRSPLKRPTATEIKQHDLLASAQLSQPVIERIYHRRRTISSNSSNE